MDNKMYWYNFKTGKYDYIETPADFMDYIPQSPSAQSLYKLYIEARGKSPVEACCKVLEIVAGYADSDTTVK